MQYMSRRPGIGERLTQLRRSRGWTQLQLAHQAKVDVSTISRIESGDTPNPGSGTVTKLAAGLGVALSAVTGEVMTAPSTATFRGVAFVPIVQISVHAGREGGWQEVGETEVVPAELERGRRLLAARVVGTCLSPEVEPGDIVIFDQARLEPQDGEMVVVTVAGEGVLVKRAYRNGAGGWILVANDHQRLPAQGSVIEGVVVRVSKNPVRKPLPPLPSVPGDLD